MLWPQVLSQGDSVLGGPDNPGAALSRTKQQSTIVCLLFINVTGGFLSSCAELDFNVLKNVPANEVRTAVFSVEVLFRIGIALLFPQCV